VRLTLWLRPDLIEAGWVGFPADLRRVIAEVAREEGIVLPRPAEP
jgi:hypothetical protein